MKQSRTAAILAVTLPLSAPVCGRTTPRTIRAGQIERTVNATDSDLAELKVDL